MDDIDAFCATCRKPLEGAVEVVKTTFRGIALILLKETPDRNWIGCNGCGSVVCKSCCRHPLTGYCNRCLEYILEISVKIPRTAVFQVPLAVLRVWQRLGPTTKSKQPTGGIN